MRNIRFAVALGLIVVGPQMHHLWVQSADEAAIKRIEQIWDDSWNRHDTKGMAAVLAEDADFVNVNGERFKGRSAFQALMTRAHAMQFKDRSHLVIRFLSGSPWQEAQLLQCAHAYEQVTNWHARRPTIMSRRP